MNKCFSCKFLKDCIKYGEWFVQCSEVFYREIDKPKKVKNSGYSYHDSCSCGTCPNCNASIDTWNSYHNCSYCGQKLEW